MASAALATFFGASCSFVPHCSTPNQPVMSLQWSVECSPSFFNLFEVGEKSGEGVWSWQAERHARSSFFSLKGPSEDPSSHPQKSRLARSPSLPTIAEPRNGPLRNLESY